MREIRKNDDGSLGVKAAGEEEVGGRIVILLLPAAHRKIMIGKQHHAYFALTIGGMFSGLIGKWRPKIAKLGITPILLQRISLIPDGLNSAHLRGFQIKKKTVI